MSDWRYFQVVEAMEAKGIDIGNYEILIDGSSLNGELISGVSISSDENWVCVPVHDEEAEMMTGQYEYRPQCFEVVARYEMWVSNGSMANRVEIRFLRS